jgi:hypothetical protein
MLQIHPHNGLDDANAKMPMALQTQCDEGVKISEASARRIVSNATTTRETSVDHTARIHKHPKRHGFEEEKGQLREWMTVAIDRPAWALKVKYKLDLPPGSFTNLRRH